MGSEHQRPLALGEPAGIFGEGVERVGVENRGAAAAFGDRGHRGTRPGGLAQAGTHGQGVARRQMLQRFTGGRFREVATVSGSGSVITSACWVATSARTDSGVATVTSPTPLRNAPRATSTAAPALPRPPATARRCP